ncbi:hypothetical protein LCGC14_2673890 [marine sediment metagenome]|uniref:Uncharacterized protein n=1 Tax=marine sediment metagenome TaxID=412755 RepID=A0A0F8ZNA2_9ZZZZ
MEPGDIVEVVNGKGDENFIEGKAKLIRPSEIDNDGLNLFYEWWVIEFLDEPGQHYDRIIGSISS